MSRRFVIEMLNAVYNIPLSLGTLVACEMEMADALEKPYDDIKQAVRAAAALHIDETGWHCFQARPWVSVLASTHAVLYGIRSTRGGCDI